MALKILRKPSETLLELKNPDSGLLPINYIFEAEYHQEKYVSVCEKTSQLPGAFKVGDIECLTETIHRGIQPKYADDENDPSTLEWEGLVLPDGTQLGDDNGKQNVCALKSACIRFGYIDLNLARSTSREFYNHKKKKAGIQKNDVLINSTGDGTIGRVAVFQYDFPAIVDGHITIVRLKDPDLAWYLAAYLLSEDGQKQIYRYINGSSGQVEIYPQDIERIWVKPADKINIKNIATNFQAACKKHYEFDKDLKYALSQI
jgi:hypothetical protein